MDNPSGKFDKLFHDYGTRIFFVLVGLVVLLLSAIWSYVTQKSQNVEESRVGTVIQQ